MNLGKAYIIDFDDSFTYNVATYFYNRNIEVEVISFKKITLLKDIIDGPAVIVYGPGPGHPDEYRDIFFELKTLLAIPEIFHLGVCLGHQLLWRVMGSDIVKSLAPKHGRRREFTLPSWPLIFKEESFGKKGYVQYYNSLVVESNRFDLDNCVRDELGECVATRFLGGVTYQFHPESVGTSFPEVFFYPAYNFLYNSKDDRKS